MGQIRKIGEVYYIEFYARGLLYSQVAGLDLQAAEQLLNEVEAKINGGESLTIVRHIDLVDFFERFLVQAKKEHTLATLRRFSKAIEDFKNFLPKEFPCLKQLDGVTPSVIESYKAYLAKVQRPKVVNWRLLLIRDVLEFGIKIGFLNDNPSLHVRLLPWPHTAHAKPTERYKTVKRLLAAGAGLGKIAQALNISDIAKLLYYANLIPLSREDMYN